MTFPLFCHALIQPSLQLFICFCSLCSLVLSLNVSVPSQPMCILLSSYSSTSSFPVPTSFCIYPFFLLSLPASSLASVIPHGLIIISKRDSGLLLRAVLPWNNMCILNQAPQQGPGWFIDATGEDTLHRQSRLEHVSMWWSQLSSTTNSEWSPPIH